MLLDIPVENLIFTTETIQNLILIFCDHRFWRTPDCILFPHWILMVSVYQRQENVTATRDIQTVTTGTWIRLSLVTTTFFQVKSGLSEMYIKHFVWKSDCCRFSCTWLYYMYHFAGHPFGCIYYVRHLKINKENVGILHALHISVCRHSIARK